MEDTPRPMTEEEAQAERDEIAAEVFGESPAVPSAPVVEKEPEPDPDPEPDPWAGVNPALRDQFESMGKRLEDYDTMAARLKQAESRIGGITNRLHEAEAKKKEADAAPTQEEIDAAAESEELLDELKAEFPVWGSVFDQHQARVENLNEKVDKLTEALGNNGNSGLPDEKLSRMREELRVEIKHPDWENTVHSDEYRTWFSSQPAAVQEKANSVLSKDAIEVLDSFNKHIKSGGSLADIEDKRKKRLAGSQLPSPRGSRTVVKSNDDLTDDEYRDKVAAEFWPEK